MSESRIDFTTTTEAVSVPLSNVEDDDCGLVMSPLISLPSSLDTKLTKLTKSSSPELLSRISTSSSGYLNDVDARVDIVSCSGSSDQSSEPNSFSRVSISSKSTGNRLNQISLEDARNRSYLVGSLTRGSLLGAEQLDAHFPNRFINVFVGTWNTNGVSDAPLNLDEFLLPRDCGVDDLPELYVVGTQENVMPRNEWETVMQETIGLSHVLFRSAVLGTLHLAVFIRRELLWFCSEPESGNIATRQGSAIKTKGAAAMTFHLFGTSFLFINSHLTAHDQNVRERINDYLKIRRGLDLSRKGNISSNPTHVSAPNKDVTSKFDCVFWLGDLNFRLEIERQQLMDKINGANFSCESLLKTDQLLTTMVQGNAFVGFSEGPVRFLPTFKYDIGSNTYDTSNKNRTPAYTDRILFRTRKKDVITCMEYHSVPSIMTSDHKPVFAIFKVKLRPGRDDIPLAAGHYVRSVYLKAVEKRALLMDPLYRQNESRFCSLM